jgi:hypothetical protein
VDANCVKDHLGVELDPPDLTTIDQVEAMGQDVAQACSFVCTHCPAPLIVVFPLQPELGTGPFRPYFRAARSHMDDCENPDRSMRATSSQTQGALELDAPASERIPNVFRDPSQQSTRALAQDGTSGGDDEYEGSTSNPSTTKTSIQPVQVSTSELRTLVAHHHADPARTASRPLRLSRCPGSTYRDVIMRVNWKVAERLPSPRVRHVFQIDFPAIAETSEGFVGRTALRTPEGLRLTYFIPKELRARSLDDEVTRRLRTLARTGHGVLYILGSFLPTEDRSELLLKPRFKEHVWPELELSRLPPVRF